MNLATLLRICKLYVRLGWSVHDQLESVLDGDDLDDQNPNALRTIRDDFLIPLTRRIVTTDHAPLGDDIDELIDEINDHLGEK